MYIACKKSTNHQRTNKDGSKIENSIHYNDAGVRFNDKNVRAEGIFDIRKEEKFDD